MKKKERDKRDILVRDGQRCYFCHKPMTLKKMTLDHYYPKSLRGPSVAYNYVCACKSCNKYKKATIPKDYQAVLAENFYKALKAKKIHVVKHFGYTLREIIDMMSYIEAVEIKDKEVVFKGAYFIVNVREHHIIDIKQRQRGNDYDLNNGTFVFEAS